MDDPAFETLQALFPGRIVSIEADAQEPEEEDAAPEEAETDEREE